MKTDPWSLIQCPKVFDFQNHHVHSLDFLFNILVRRSIVHDVAETAGLIGKRV